MDHAILEATRGLLAADSYADLSMESVAARAQVGKKSLYRRWPSKAPLVADAVLDAYGRGGSFGVPDTTDIRADLQSWLIEHAEFIADPSNAALIRALIAAAASNPSDNTALYERLSAPQHAGLMTRLRHAAEKGELRRDADLDAIAKALIGTLLLEVLTRTATSGALATRYDGLLDVILRGAAGNTRKRGGG
ncbi:TetR/AcrR family transcriptional regulator [Mycobacterium sp.]|uniref:TetR/AcrR family transcriptional regulator n=1 Tax=Mycobacterium sp. TaxID=1785 RepID=UPI002D9B1EA8|nr:TetR/AcrR family transcriptional regulator [Mycobacterium sp.]